jgi:hypothetical protein
MKMLKYKAIEAKKKLMETDLNDEETTLLGEEQEV